MKKVFTLLAFLLLSYFLFNAFRIYNYSTQYSKAISDVAIVIGAGTKDGKVSPIFRERINHGVYLIKKDVVKKIIITGGTGKGQKIPDSEAGRTYALSKGISINDIIIETNSNYTIENLSEAKLLMDSLGLNTALLVSDPLHMKRSMGLSKKLGLNSKPSPTKTSMYKTNGTKISFLLYETLFYSLGEVVGKN